MSDEALSIYGIVAAFAAFAGWCAARRIAARSYAPLIATLVALLAGAGLCAAISSAKTGGFLPGIVGFLLGCLLLSLAGGSLLGAVLRLVWRGLRHEDPAAAPPAMTPAWDLIGFSALSLIAVVLSAME